MISLTEEQALAVNLPDSAALSACPGSGKTRVILAKLIKLAEEVEDTPRFVACITYTNAAVDEIESRLKQIGGRKALERIEVATIHSFCLHFVVRPYQWLIPEIPKSFKILSPQLKEFEKIVEGVENSFGRQITRTTLDDYASLRVGINGKPEGAGIVQGVVTPESALLYWDQVRKKGFLDFSMILYYSFSILNAHSFVAQGLSSRFRWLLVDEYQDTTDIQLQILKLLANIRLSSFFLVGDPHQSIQGFAGARPDLGQQFVKDINARTDLSLTGNFRSSALIVRLSENVISRVPKMEAVGRLKDFPVAPSYFHGSTAMESVAEEFLPMLAEHEIPLGNAAILAPWWQHLIPIARRLREFDVPVFGPGARPYRRSRLFASLAEQLGACSEADDLLGLPGVEKALFRLIYEVTGQSSFEVFTYSGRMTALSLVYVARSVATTAAGGAEWLRVCSAEVARILVHEDLLPSSIQSLLPLSVEEMLADMQRSGVDIANLGISDLGLFADPSNALKLTTLHNAKGREFDAVALVHMNDGQIPHFASLDDPDAVEESRRLFYVGVTRARRILWLCSDNSNRRNPPSRFISQCGLG